MSGVLIAYLGSTVASGGGVPQVVSPTFPLPVTISGGIGGLAVAGVQAAGVVATENPVMTGGVDGGGIIRNFLTDATGILQVNATLAGGSVTVVGNVASGAADAGNPVKMGAVYNSTLPTFTTGQRADVQVGTRGSLDVTLFTADSTSPIFSTNTIADASANTRQALWTSGFSNIYNGASWDRNYKPRTAFRLPTSAATNNAANIKTTAGTVLQISANVTLAASTCYLKFFDVTGAPNPAATNPLYMFALNIVNGFVSINLPAGGLYFPTGIGVAIVANPADLDNTAIAAGQITALNVSFQ